jgi:anti-anti-sigma regulatory factor
MSDLKTLTIDNAEELKKTLLALSKKGGTPVFDFSGIEAIDLSGIQILVAFAREALSNNAGFHFIGKIQESVSASFVLAGIAERSCETGEEVELFIKAVL